LLTGRSQMSESLNNMPDASDGWVQDVRLSEKEMCALLSWIYFVTRDYCRLDIFYEPAREI
jgi:hypothetical protein